LRRGIRMLVVRRHPGSDARAAGSASEDLLGLLCFAFGSNRGGRFNTPVARYRQCAHRGDIAALHRVRNGRIQSADITGYHGVHLGPCGVPSVALVAPAPKDLCACLVGIGFLHRRDRHDVDIKRGTISDFWSIVIANAILAAAYGIIWSGVRNFEGKRVSVVLTLAGVPIWLGACSIGSIYALPAARATVMAAIAITYALLAVLELWRGRGEDVWRWPIMLLLLGHAAAITIRVPLAASATNPNSFDVDLLTFVIFETVFVCICAAYLFGGLAKDRVAARYQRASLIDPLTGVANRRGFLQAGERLMVRTRFARRPVALLLFDLDRFKSINDKFGHGAGDAVLIAFCQLATSQLRPTDLFGRIGGEEFAGLLPDTAQQDALWLAERLRAAFEATSRTVAERPLIVTVSVGVAISNDASFDLSTLLDAADQALYCAKALGRNRVELSAHSAAPRSMKQRAGVQIEQTAVGSVIRQKSLQSGQR
jgi:diguanylate cyclase (GGDEF)-like protein